MMKRLTVLPLLVGIAVMLGAFLAIALRGYEVAQVLLACIGFAFLVGFATLMTTWEA